MSRTRRVTSAAFLVSASTVHSRLPRPFLCLSCLTSLSSALELLHLSSGHRMSKPQFLPLYHARVSKYLAVQNICLIPLIQYILLLPAKCYGQIFLDMHGYGITPSPSMPTAKCNLSPNCFSLPSPTAVDWSPINVTNHLWGG